MVKELAEVLVKHLKISEDDAIVAAIFAIAGFSIDSIFFAGGIPTPTVTLLSGAGGMLASRWLKNRAFFQKRVLQTITKLKDEGYISEGEAKELQAKLIKSWARRAFGIEDEEESSK